LLNDPPLPVVAIPETPVPVVTVELTPIPTVPVETIPAKAVNELVTVFAPAKVCVPVVITPLAVALASGKLNVCVSTELAILKSVPVLPTAKY
jgi:hypothetical protein